MYVIYYIIYHEYILFGYSFLFYYKISLFFYFKYIKKLNKIKNKINYILIIAINADEMENDYYVHIYLCIYT